MKAKKGNLFTSNIHEELGICHSSFNPAQFCPIQAIKSKIKPISFFSGEFVRTLMNIVIKKKEKVTSNQVDQRFCCRKKRNYLFAAMLILQLKKMLISLFPPNVLDKWTWNGIGTQIHNLVDHVDEFNILPRTSVPQSIYSF